MSDIEHRADRLSRLRGMPFHDLRAEEAAVEPEPQIVQPTSSASMLREEDQVSPICVVYDPTPADPAFSLRHPFTIESVRYDTLLFRPPAFDDVDAVMQGRMSELEMQARMADVPVAVLRALRWDDCEIATFIARRLSPDLRRS